MTESRHPSQDQSLIGSGATQPSVQYFLGTLVGKGLQGPYKKVLAAGSMIDRQALPLQKIVGVPCVSWAFPARANCASKGEVWRLFKGMMLPAVCRARSQLGSSLTRLREGSRHRKGKMTTGAHPFIDGFTALFSIICFLSEKVRSCPGHSMLMVLGIYICD